MPWAQAETGSCSRDYAEIHEADGGEALARSIGLHYGFSGLEDGIRRKGRPGNFRYLTAAGKEVTDPRALKRIHELRLPPGYHEVRISADPEAHIQAIARDAKGREQYRYHPKWTEASKAKKFERMQEFGRAIGLIRVEAARDLAAEGLAERRVTAGLARLLDASHARIGGKRYLDENGTAGLSTLSSRQVTVQGRAVRLRFTGKEGVRHDIRVTDPGLAALVRELKGARGRSGDLPLFSYRDAEGVWHPVGAARVNDYVKDASGGDFSAKDFRTWEGTVAAARVLLGRGVSASPEERSGIVREAVAQAALRLGNTPAVARESYVSPELLEAFERGDKRFRRSRTGDVSEAEAESFVIRLLAAGRGAGTQPP